MAADVDLRGSVTNNYTGALTTSWRSYLLPKGIQFVYAEIETIAADVAQSRVEADPGAAASNALAADAKTLVVALGGNEVEDQYLHVKADSGTPTINLFWGRGGAI